MKAFLLPAILGDEPQLIALRTKLEGRIDFELLELPGIEAPAAVLSSLQDTARALGAEIVRRQPTGAVALIGFSFGASLALEVAAQLTRQQRPVSFLGVLDGAFGTNELQRSKAELLRLGLSFAGIASLIHRLLERLNNRRKLITAAWAGMSNTAQSPAVQEALLIDYRCKALNTWQPPACAAPGVLIFSGALGAENRRRWTALCPHLTGVDVAAKHGDFLKGPSLALIVEALAARSTGV